MKSVTEFPSQGFLVSMAMTWETSTRVEALITPRPMQPQHITLLGRRGPPWRVHLGVFPIAGTDAYRNLCLSAHQDPQGYKKAYLALMTGIQDLVILSVLSSASNPRKLYFHVSIRGPLSFANIWVNEIHS